MEGGSEEGETGGSHQQPDAPLMFRMTPYGRSKSVTPRPLLSRHMASAAGVATTVTTGEKRPRAQSRKSIAARVRGG